MSAVRKEYRRITTKSVVEMKANSEKISILTAYDYTFTGLLDSAGIDVLLVDDFASNVMTGHETTLPVTLDQMTYHASSAIGGVTCALVVVDLPFGTYQSDPKEALCSATRIMKESGAHAIELEGGKEEAESIRRTINAGIPVMGHLGLTPQSIHQFSGFDLRVKEEAEAQKLKEDAKLLEQLGCFAIVLEKIPAALAEEVAKSICIPIIGIGAGNGVDGQVLITRDMLGISNEFYPKFLRKYANLQKVINETVTHCITDVKSVDFPNENESYQNTEKYLDIKGKVGLPNVIYR